MSGLRVYIIPTYFFSICLFFLYQFLFFFTSCHGFLKYLCTQIKDHCHHLQFLYSNSLLPSLIGVQSLTLFIAQEPISSTLHYTSHCYLEVNQPEAHCRAASEHGHFISPSQMHPFPKVMMSNFNFHAVDAKRTVLAGMKPFRAGVIGGQVKEW